jgi:ribosomal protein S18 acetylase RimI-like enzyme
MAEDAVVRPAGPEDVPAAARLAAELVRLHHGLDPARFMCIEPLEEGYAHFLRTQIGREDSVVLVATVDGAVVGYVLAGLVGRDWMDLRDACGMLHDVYVDPAARGAGLGRRLVEEAAARLIRLGAPRVLLMTAWANPGARRFFESLGFRPTMLEMTRETGEGP